MHLTCGTAHRHSNLSRVPSTRWQQPWDFGWPGSVEKKLYILKLLDARRVWPNILHRSTLIIINLYLQSLQCMCPCSSRNKCKEVKEYLLSTTSRTYTFMVISKTLALHVFDTSTWTLKQSIIPRNSVHPSEKNKYWRVSSSVVSILAIHPFQILHPFAGEEPGFLRRAFSNKDRAWTKEHVVQLVAWSILLWELSYPRPKQVWRWCFFSECGIM